MGVHANISKASFPRQGDYMHARCKVVFHYDTSKSIGGTIVRDDSDDPFVTLIRLDDGRYVLGTECQYMPEHSQCQP